MNPWLRTVTGLLAITTGVLTGCGEANPDSNDTDTGENATRITTTAAERTTVTVQETTVGELRSHSRPAITAEVPGRIQTIHVDEGDTVTADQVLVTIDREPYQLALAQARTDVRRLESELQTQRDEFERVSALLDDGYVTRSRYDQASNRVTSTEEQLEAARVRVRDARRELRRTRIRAPVAGGVDARLASEGDYAATGEPLLRLVGRDSLQVLMPFPESVARRLQTGQRVRLHAPAAGDTVTTRISDIRPGLAGAGHAFRAIATLTNPGGWRPGGSVDATVTVAERESVVVPAKALVQRPDREVVYRIEDGSAREQAVSVGQRMAGRVEIRDGLEPGQTIAVDGAGFLSDGAPVTAQGDE